MNIMLNIIPSDPKQNAVVQNVSSKSVASSDKSAKGFAKVLTNETDKKELNVDSKLKGEDNEQLMAAMAGMIIPMVVNSNVDKQETGDVASTLEGMASGAKTQLVDVVPVVPQTQLTDIVSAVSQNQKVNAVSGDIGLAALLPQKATVKTQVDTAQLNEFAELQLQSQSQVEIQMQNKSSIGQVEVMGISIKNNDMLTKEPALSNVIPSLTTIGNAGMLGRSSNKQLEGKKIVGNQTNIEVTDAANMFGVVENADVKPVLALQPNATTANNLADGEKGNLSTLLGTKKQLNEEVILPNQSVKNTDEFASLLNQQSSKIDNQSGMPEVKQVASQPVSDPYNISSQIIEQARLVAKNQNTEMIIQLKPEHLGELTFKVTIENGFVSASFHSNNAEVRSMIESTLAQLKQDLSNQGLKIDNVGVYGGLGQFFSNGQHSGSNQQPVVKVQNKKNTEEFLDVFEATDSADRALDVSGVDYRV